MIVALTAVLSTTGQLPHSSHSRRKWLRGALAPTSCCLGSVRSCHSCAAAAAAMALSYLLLLLLLSPAALSSSPHLPFPPQVAAWCRSPFHLLPR